MSKYSDETKAAVMAALLAGQSINGVAREYNIPPGTVSNWKNRQGVPRNGIQKRSEQIGDLLLSYLHENLKTLQVQSIAFRNEDWLSRQDASDVAVLHGVLTDKAVRLIEAMSHVSDDTDTDS
jgi:transposase-like protein